MNKRKGGQAPRLPAYRAEYLLFGALLAYGNRLQALGDGFTARLPQNSGFAGLPGTV